jgi:hypothetical protein
MAPSVSILLSAARTLSGSHFVVCNQPHSLEQVRKSRAAGGCSLRAGPVLLADPSQVARYLLWRDVAAAASITPLMSRAATLPPPRPTRAGCITSPSRGEKRLAQGHGTRREAAATLRRNERLSFINRHHSPYAKETAVLATTASESSRFTHVLCAVQCGVYYQTSSL